MTTDRAPIKLPTGVLLGSTEYEAQGRYISADKVRFFDRAPEKIGGWEQWNTPGDELPDICRSIFCWQDFSYNLWHAFGTAHRLWVFDQDKARTNITPYVSTGTLANPFTTTNTLTTVNVNDTAHGLAVGQYVYFSGASAVGGITINGEYVVTLVTDTDNYKIEHSIAATSSAGPGGGASVGYNYELAPGNTSAATGGGWGIGTWGASTWGTERATLTFLILPRFMSFDKYGQYLIVQVSGGRLYEWQANTANRAALITNSPASGEFAFVTSERIIVVLGAGGDLMRLDWCDDDDNTIWTPADDNTANTRKLQEGSRLIAGARLGQQVNMIWSDTAAYIMQWLGNNFVYSTRIVGQNSGIMGPAAFVLFHGVAFWMSQRTFHMFNGSVEQIPNVHDIETIFGDINEAQRHKIFAHVNLEFREIWWFYPSLNADECDKYVILNLEDFSWTPGTMDRTAAGTRLLNGVDAILMTDEAGVIYEHEVGVNADGAALDWHLETGYFDLQSGGVSMNVDGYIPDFSAHVSDIDLTWTSRDYPESTAALETVTAVIAVGQEIVDLRHYGRQCKFKVSQTAKVGGDFALGLQRIEVGASGSRR